MEIEKVEYGEAVRMLAKQAGIELKTDYYKERGENKGDIYDIYRICSEFYQAELQKPEHAEKLAYLHRR
jgi:DNA primase